MSRKANLALPCLDRGQTFIARKAVSAQSRQAPHYNTGTFEFAPAIASLYPDAFEATISRKHRLKGRRLLRISHIADECRLYVRMQRESADTRREAPTQGIGFALGCSFLSSWQQR